MNDRDFGFNPGTPVQNRGPTRSTQRKHGQRFEVVRTQLIAQPVKTLISEKQSAASTCLPWHGINGNRARSDQQSWGYQPLHPATRPPKQNRQPDQQSSLWVHRCYRSLTGHDRTIGNAQAFNPLHAVLGLSRHPHLGPCGTCQPDDKWSLRVDGWRHQKHRFATASYCLVVAKFVAQHLRQGALRHDGLGHTFPRRSVSKSSAADNACASNVGAAAGSVLARVNRPRDLGRMVIGWT